MLEDSDVARECLLLLLDIGVGVTGESSEDEMSIRPPPTACLRCKTPRTAASACACAVERMITVSYKPGVPTRIHRLHTRSTSEVDLSTAPNGDKWVESENSESSTSSCWAKMAFSSSSGSW